MDAASGAQNPVHLAQSCIYAGGGAQSSGDQHVINRRVGEGEVLAVRSSLVRTNTTVAGLASVLSAAICRPLDSGLPPIGGG